MLRGRALIRRSIDDRVRGAALVIVAFASGACGRVGFTEHDIVDATTPTDASSLDASLDATGLDAMGLDAPGSDAPGSDAPGSDAPGSDAPGSDAPDASSLDASDGIPNRAFVTRGLFDGALGGVSGADAHCRDEAAAAGIPGDYVAWLRATDRPMPSALLAGSHGWALPSGRWLADEPAQIEDGSFLRPLYEHADGARVDSGGDSHRVWTGDNGITCSEWTSTSALGDQHWIPQWHRLSDGELDCASRYRLFCFERGRSVARPPTPITGARLFVSSGTWAPNDGGLASADALCAAEAGSVGVLRGVRALLPTTTTSALDRVGVYEFQRMDGLALGRPGSGATQETYVLFDATGAPVMDEIGIWTAGDPGALPSSTCGDWASPSGLAISGQTADWPGFEAITQPCSTAQHLYCVIP